MKDLYFSLLFYRWELRCILGGLALLIAVALFLTDHRKR